jgi:hypothetical protein
MRASTLASQFRFGSSSVIWSTVIRPVPLVHKCHHEINRPVLFYREGSAGHDLPAAAVLAGVLNEGCGCEKRAIAADMSDVSTGGWSQAFPMIGLL